MSIEALITDADGREVARVDLPRELWPVSVGSDSSARIVLSGLAPRHATLDWRGNHILLTAHVPGSTRAHGRALASGEAVRVDGATFVVGTWSITLSSKED